MSSVEKSKEFYEMQKGLKRACHELKKFHDEVGDFPSLTDEEVLLLEREIEAGRAMLRLLDAVLKGGYTSVDVDTELFEIEERRQWGDNCLVCGDAWPSDGSHDCSCVSH